MSFLLNWQSSFSHPTARLHRSLMQIKCTDCDFFYLFTVIGMVWHWIQCLVDQAFLGRMRRKASLKSSLITVESYSSALDYHIFDCQQRQFRQCFLYVCHISFYTLFYANNKKSKSFSCEWILYLDWDEISFLLLCAQQGKSAARIFLYPVSILSFSHEFFIFIYAYKPTLLWANEWMG